MKDLILTLPKSKKPMFIRLADAIRTAIRDGAILPGESLPSSRDLAARFKIHRHTVMNAIGELTAEGWIESQARTKYRVTANLPSKFLQAKDSHHAAIKIPVQKIEVRRSMSNPARIVPEHFKYQFPSGAPDIRLFPVQELKSHLYDALSSTKNLTYGEPAGHERLIKQIDIYLRHMRHITDRDILITNGSQESIFLLAQLFIAKGESIAVEALSYPPAIAALKFAGATLNAIPVDDEGIDVDYLERLLQKKRIRLLYLTPLHQYPTTVTLSAARRLKLYEIACKHGMLILEDDYDHEFHYDSQPIAPLASFDPAGLVLYVSTFSKVLYPSARIGFMAVPRSISRELAILKRISSRQNESLIQDGVGRWMESGGFERHLRRMRRTYEERRNQMNEDLMQIKQSYPKLNWQSPEGGMALWLDVGVDTDRLAAEALKRGVYVTPESWHQIQKKPGNHLRLGFSGQTCDENTRGLKALFPLAKL